MPNLEDKLSKAFAPVLADLVRKTAEALRAMSIEEVLALSGLERRSAPRVRRSRTTKASASPSKGRSSTNTEAVLSKLVPMLKAAPNGVSGEAIKKELGLSRGGWRSVMRAGLASGAMRKKGVRRATLYFAGTKRSKK